MEALMIVIESLNEQMKIFDSLEISLTNIN